ncbi:PLP-dependent aminotransferase family protein [Brevibacillus invocatus]|uniref:MocR-like pyridoxine biosynthesis transcription factor PdxR n=1 Tax=Brevibacillus invocatus TaxID=173959 RepID=UPI00203E5233|nr:PLP-dependent aminotransferase family protein [Brevibacillus invocatus]MCM3080478.1 PLP-dependent aminotransferase family protein [Brevibacillus invocatus]MCM3430601.1 PLP-dependent aminotransferase family protein [Brevibacillus invocatus]
MDEKESKTKPRYKQIAEQMEQRISIGEFPPGHFLPSERLLAKELHVNRSTIVAAYDELQAAGVVERKRGSGTIVSRDIWGLARTRVPNWRHLSETGSFRPNLPLIRKIRKETHTNEMIDLATGELSPDLVPHQSLKHLMTGEDFPTHLSYGHPQGNESLRDTLGNHMKTWRNIEVNPSSILITSGAQQALHLVVQCLLQPGDAVAIEEPSYCYSLPLFRSSGLRTFPLPVDKDGIIPEQLAELHRKHRIKMVFLNPNYQNPTGSLLSLERRHRLLALSAENGIPIIEDDPYSLTSFSGESVPTLKSLDRHGTVLYISSLTKIVASGLRIGWIVGPQTVIERLADAKQQFDYGHSIFPQWLADKFLSSSDFSRHMDLLRSQLLLRRDQLVTSLQGHFGDQAELVIPAGGIHLWCGLAGEWNESQLLREAVKRGTIFVPGHLFGAKDGYVRFTFGRADADEIREAVSRFADAFTLSG